MAIRYILTGNNPVLRGQAKPVEKINRPTIQLLDDMAETMYHAQGVGLAAPQVGVPKRIIVVDPGENQLLEMINPVLVENGGEEVDIEGCLSLPGLMGEVPRAERVVIHYLDREEREIELKVSGLTARIIQHEIDHLNGVLFIDRAVCITETTSENGDTE